jgi:hypothetical protein
MILRMNGPWNTMVSIAALTTTVVMLPPKAVSFNPYANVRGSFARAGSFQACSLAPKRQRPSFHTTKAFAMSASPPRLNVALDQPLPVNIFSVESSRSLFGSSLLWKLKQFGTCPAIVRVGFIAALLVGLYFSYLTIAEKNKEDGPLHGLFSRIKGFILSLVERISDAVAQEKETVPMPFDNESDGWNVCTLRSIKRFGKTRFYRYDFDLPEPDFILPLTLGQTVSLSCLDSEKNAVQAEFFPFQPDRKVKPGSFSLLLPGPFTLPTAMSTSNGSVSELSNLNDAQQTNLIQVLQNDMRAGDEIAIQPGSARLEYLGQHLPVTDIVYIAEGTGIAPVLDQVRAVLPEMSGSSVESVTVIWINSAVEDFDVTAELLEKEYNKYNKKLAVFCVLDDFEGRTDLAENKEINGAVSIFQPGTMAVLAGPSASMKKAAEFLQEGKGFPNDCVCLL